MMKLSGYRINVSCYYVLAKQRPCYENGRFVNIASAKQINKIKRIFKHKEEDFLSPRERIIIL